MPHRTIMLIPTEMSIGLASISLGIIRAIERKGVHTSIFKIVARSYTEAKEKNVLNQNTITTCRNSNLSAVKPLKMSHITSLLSSNQKDMLMDEITANYYVSTQGSEIVFVEGLVPTLKHQFVQSLNFEIAKTLSAEIVFVISQNANTLEQLKDSIKITYCSFGGAKNSNIIGVIVNKLNVSIEAKWYTNLHPDIYEIFDNSSKTKVMEVNSVKEVNSVNLQDFSPLPVLGVVPWKADLIAIRAIDVARCLNATIINEGDINTRRIKSVIFCEYNISHMIKCLRTGSLLVISADHPNVLVAACLAAMNGVEIGAILLTCGYKVDACISKLCEVAFATGLPILMVNTDIWQTSLSLQSLNLELPVDDYERIKKIQKHVASHINYDWIESLTTISERNYHLSPSAFRYQLTELARKAGKRIVLPEGNEPRTIKAATICAERGIATCVLLGNPDEINHIASSLNVKLGTGIEIVNPKTVRDSYVARLVKLRKKKGVTEAIAREQLKDNVVLGTMMLEQNKVDGLVSGAAHTTANTIRPPLQLIKTAPGSSLVSSVFFMLMPEQVYVYGDCAINLDPTAEQLAEIAIQSADSAIIFGIEPYVAMLSYSTGTSGTGRDVEKVREATYIAQEQRPDLMIDGPLQYDTAVVADVAKHKAPDSLVAGRATVFIFPDLNTGNTVYKAVQRSADLTSIGPILQGMRKPVNDLSRGALIDDIIYTIAITAIQSSKQQ